MIYGIFSAIIFSALDEKKRNDMREVKMTLRDISNGPDWIMWAAFLILAVISIVLLSGRGANLIAGYNTASKEEKSKYDEKKLCKVTGIGMSLITILVLISGIGMDTLPAYFAYVILAVVLIDCVVMIILMNTICKKENE